jgi:hypothetical protein
MKLHESQSAFALDVAKLISWINQSGYSVTFGEAMRTPEQAAHYATLGIGITDSLHCKRLAVDLNLFNGDGVYLSDTKSYEEFGVFWESLNSHNRWGGRFKKPDGNHFERNE